MEISIFLTISVVLMLGFFLGRKTIHLYEIILIWMLSIFLYEIHLSLISMNYQFIQLSTEISSTWMLAFQQVIITPIIISWYFQLSSILSNIGGKLALSFVFALLLTGIEVLAKELEMIKYLKWQSTYSFIIFLVLISIIAVIRAWYRTILQREKELL